MSVEEAAEEEEDANALQKDGVGGGEGGLAESAAVGLGEKRGLGKGVAWEVDVGEGSHRRKWIDGAGHYNNRGQVAHIYTHTHTHKHTHTRRTLKQLRTGCTHIYTYTYTPTRTHT